MTTYIAILRGINVGGKRTIKMEALRQLCSSIGFQNSKTYIQSGNVIFQHSATQPQQLAEQLTQAISNTFSFEVPTIVIELNELKKIVSQNPFTEDKSMLSVFFHVTFLSEAPIEDAVNKIKEKSYQDDSFYIVDQTIYLYCPNGYSNSKLTNNFFESKLKVIATTRNWATTNELLKLAEEMVE